MTNHDELLARLDWLGKNNNLLWEEQSWCINAAAAIRSLKAQLEAKEEERKLHERAAHDSDIRCQAAVRSEKTEHRVREEAERKMMNDIQPCCQEWHTCTKRCAPLAENWRMAAKAAEQRLAQIEAENKQLREALAPFGCHPDKCEHSGPACDYDRAIRALRTAAPQEVADTNSRPKAPAVDPALVSAPPPVDAAAHPEDFCEKCGGRNITWFAPSPLWNKFAEGYNILCPLCFVELAEPQPDAWKIAPEFYADPAAATVQVPRECDLKGRAYAPTTGEQSCYICGAHAFYNQPLICKRTGTVAPPVVRYTTGVIERISLPNLVFAKAEGAQWCFTFDKIHKYRGEYPKEIGLKVGCVVTLGVLGNQVQSAMLAAPITTPASQEQKL